MPRGLPRVVVQLRHRPPLASLMSRPRLGRPGPRHRSLLSLRYLARVANPARRLFNAGYHDPTQATEVASPAAQSLLHPALTRP
jgi:hypothetical protein